ncbi:unnamed protein product, partial [Meganyctiphanes norvegica]
MAGSSKSAKRSKNEFPDTLAGFGYHFNKDGAMCNIKTGNPFQFVVKEGNQSYNQKHYEALGEVVTEHIYGLLESECGLKRVPVPKKAPNKENSSFMFMSEDALTNPEKLLVLIHGSGVVRAGQWARRLIINDTLESGTQLPFIKQAIKESYGVIVMNTNYNVRKTSEGDIRLKGSVSYTPENTVDSDHIPQVVMRHHKIKADNFVGVCPTSLLFAKFKADFKNRVFAVAMTDSVHYISHPNAYRLLIKISQNWAASNKPLDTPLTTSDGDIPRVSAGVGAHEQTSWCSFESIFQFFNDKLEQTKDPQDAKFQDLCNWEKDRQPSNDQKSINSGDDNKMKDVEEPQQKINECNNGNDTDTKTKTESMDTERLQESDGSHMTKTDGN